LEDKLKMFGPVKKTKIYEEIVEKIKDMIKDNRLKSGEKLPGERELAEVFRVSRSSVREALRSLETHGFLESRQGDGTYIARQPVDSLVSPLASFILTEKDGQMDLFEMRRMIEPHVAYLAAQRATLEEIDMMGEALELQEEEIAQGGTGTEIDKTFHYLMAKATKNKLFVRITDSIMDLLAESRDRYLQVEGRPEKSIARHRQLLEAVKEGNPERAAQIMREHLVDIENILFAAQRKEGFTKTAKKGG
jgi:GntR family transcriptional repressor for pyruvate dehydrogenase complex